MTAETSAAVENSIAVASVLPSVRDKVRRGEIRGVWLQMATELTTPGSRTDQHRQLADHL